MMDGFGKLCEHARRAGTRVALELTPLSNLETLAQGVALVDGAGGGRSIMSRHDIGRPIVWPQVSTSREERALNERRYSETLG